MQVMENGISKEEYDRYREMTVGERNAVIEEALPDYIILGYGYYGCSLREENGKYYLRISIGSSCD